MRARRHTSSGVPVGPPRTARTARMAAAAPPKDPPPPERGLVRRWIRAALLDNIGIKFLSLVLAVTVFLVVNTDKDREIRVTVPLKYEYPRDRYVLLSAEVPEITVTIKGPWRRLRGFDERVIGRVELDLSSTPTGDVAIAPDRINLPPGLSVTSVTPRAVRVAFDRLVEKTVEVTPVTGGTPARGHVVGPVRVTPTTVKVRGGERVLAALGSVPTHEVSVQGAEETFEEVIDLAPPAGVTAEPGQRVRVHVEIDDELVTRRYGGLAIAIRAEGGVDAAKWAVVPRALEVTLTGALLAVEKASRELSVYVRVTPADARPREAEVVIEGVPAGVGKRISPERVKIVPAKPG